VIEKVIEFFFKTDANEELHDTLVAFSKDTHRSLVIDYTNKTSPYILTQTDIIKYVYDNPECLPEIDYNSSLRSLGWSNENKKNELVVGYANETALNVYRRMAFKNLIGIPIVDGVNQQILGNLSLSDLRGLNYESIDLLVLPILEFLKHLPNSENILNPKVVTYDTSLKETLKIIIDNHIHRIWIIDENKKVLDVITLTDLINLFSKF